MSLFLSYLIICYLLAIWWILLFYNYTVHLFIKSLFLRFLSLQVLDFNFLFYFSTLQKIQLHCFINRLKYSVDCFEFLNFLFLFLIFYIIYLLFIKTYSSLLIFESIKVLRIKNSILFNLNCGNDTILLWIFFFLLIIDWYIF